MGDGAHAGPTTHEIFNKPFQVRPRTSFAKTPDNYRRGHLPTEPNLPNKMEIWHVQRTEKSFGGVVSSGCGFGDSPDAEALVLGFNEGKAYGSVGIGRHGNVLQWGYSAPPSQMTEEGRKLFLNCLCYITRFNGRLPLVRKASSPRENALRLGAVANRIKDPKFFTQTFGKELPEEYRNTPDRIVQYYVQDFELIYYDQGFRVDKDLKALGIRSNRKVETLEQLIDLLSNHGQGPVARRCLSRYVDPSFETQDQWRDWLRKARDRIFFSDFGGYKFFVAPEGYPVVKGNTDQEETLPRN